MSLIKPTSPIEILSNENYLDELQDTEFDNHKFNQKEFKSLKKTNI